MCIEKKEQGRKKRKDEDQRKRPIQHIQKLQVMYYIYMQKKEGERKT